MISNSQKTNIEFKKASSCLNDVTRRRNPWCIKKLISNLLILNLVAVSLSNLPFVLRLELRNHMRPIFFISFRYCDFKDHKNDYILIRYKSGKNGTREVADEFDKVFRYAQIPKKQRAYIHSEMMSKSRSKWLLKTFKVKNRTLGGTTPHSTSRSPTREAAEKELRSDDDLMRLIMQMYYYDFVEFGFG